ncbi:ImmA/IrrE family metallo-endopeptidase [Pseudorhodoplanes sp.]|uniref:ImmA/IrrE family metallo-endopeptidase n=1 Tax=Pseudorhodoplanes sp. TaxID=1934341 RepID=UPI003D140DDC
MIGKNSAEWRSLPAASRETIQTHQSSAPVPVGAIAKDFGLVVKVATMPADISGEIKPDATAEGGFKITVNRHEPKIRQRFTIAHEIGHYLLHRDLIKGGLTDTVLYRSKLSNSREAEANRIAADILMPWTLIMLWKEQYHARSFEGLVEEFAAKLEVSEIAMCIRFGLPIEGRK